MENRFFFKSTKMAQMNQHSRPQKGILKTPAAPVTAKPAKAGTDKKTKKTKLCNRLFSRFKEGVLKEKTAKKTSFCCWLLKCWKRKHRVAPQQEEKKNSPKPQKRNNPVEVNVSDRTEVKPFVPPQDDDPLPDVSFPARLPDTTAPKAPKLGEQSICTKRSFVGGLNGGSNAICYGLPNIGQNCYMISTLQSLLTLEDFMGDISRMENIWSSAPKAQMIKRLMEIRDARTSTNGQIKIAALDSFKAAVSACAPEFGNNQQKDAHEFLTTVLDQVRSLAPLLKRKAAVLVRTYTCPVEHHMMFKMENIRTCKSCRSQSKRLEEFTSLSLDLVPGGCVEEMLQKSLETELEFKCKCGGKTSVLKSSFATLPKVLILHLKRFRFSPSYPYRLEKAGDPVKLLRDLVVSSKQGGGCYSLVNVIDHFGTLKAGHYISESVHPEVCPDEFDDRWLTFNDLKVTETTGWSVCERRQEDAYILFYKRH
ncbi:ubiquitin carboxyl-terminal hydrolase 46-like isoform X2 [Sebastes fasciatus]|uniref:ubiquitin carboxyl-terminal hydrolase 46-like isoform X2 n=1 Tax=Sebastes fasciatus TaxID=394691 RepID=UPI003D9E7289